MQAYLSGGYQRRSAFQDIGLVRCRLVNEVTAPAGIIIDYVFFLFNKIYDGSQNPAIIVCQQEVTEIIIFRPAAEGQRAVNVGMDPVHGKDI